MKDKEHQLREVQFTMLDYDLAACKLVANWLLEHIKLREMNFKTIDASIEDLDLSNRAQKVLKENNVRSLQQLLVLASDGISIHLLKGAGKMVTQEIREKVLKLQNTYIFNHKKINMRSSQRTK